MCRIVNDHGSLGRPLLESLLVMALVWFPVTTLSANQNPSPKSAAVNPVLRIGLRDAAILAGKGADTARVDYAAQRTQEETSRLWPEIYLRGGYSYEDSSIISRSDQTVLGPGLDIERYRLELVLEYNLLQFLDSKPLIKAANASEQASLSRLELDKRKRILSAAEAYLSCWAARQQLQALRRFEQQQRAYLNELKQRQRRGGVPMLRVLRVENDVESTRGEILTTEREAAISELKLRQATGLPPQPTLVLVFKPVELDLTFVDRLGLDGLLTSTKTNNARLLAARAAVESSHWKTEAARRASYPDLDLLTSYGRVHEELSNDVDIESSDNRFSVFLNLKVPLFDGGVRHARVSQAHALEKTKIWEQRELERELKAMVEGEYWSLISQNRHNNLLKRQVRLAHEEFQQASLRRTAGVAATVESVAAYERYTRFRVAYSRGEANTYLHGIRLGLSSGHNPFNLNAASAASAQASQPATKSGSAPDASETLASAPHPKPPASKPTTSVTEQPAKISPLTGTIGLEAGKYAINLVSTLASINVSRLPQLAIFKKLRLYQTKYPYKGKSWHRLRLGFFLERAAAERMRSRLLGSFPDAWVATIPKTERQQSRRTVVTWDD